MYISVEQAHQLDKIVKSNEVALRSFISEVLANQYINHSSFDSSLRAISLSNELIYSQRFTAKLRCFVAKSRTLYSLIQTSKQSLDNKSFDNDVTYVSDLIDFLLIYFNAHFSATDIARDFSSIEEFHYCCTLYHKIRNNLSHPASRPISIQDSNKTLYFVENLSGVLNDKYYWFYSKEKIKTDIQKYNNIKIDNEPKFHNLNYASSTHKNLLCREDVIKKLYDSLLGSGLRQRLAGSVVLYGYGGVGKTAITTEFLYRLMRDKKDNKYPDLEYLLFFSSKNEYLRDNKTTGELYIDSAKPEFSTLEELKSLVCESLCISSTSSISSIDGKGIIVIDNIENIEPEEKIKILDFIKSLPRSVQFIVTSRNEELCEEKIHIEEFQNDEIGQQFVSEIIESEDLNIVLSSEQVKSILNSSKGNALIIVQILNILTQGTSTFDELVSSLQSMKSKNTEMIANFMYKNTFDNALSYLKDTGLPSVKVMQIISLYNEKIELYSISKLSNIDIIDAEKICNYLAQRLVLKKLGEYYELNEFANRFVFIKLLPDRFELTNLKDKIKTHKERMKKKLSELDGTLKENKILHQIVTEWQPRNYIDKIVIAELFSLYGEAIKSIHNKDKITYEKYLKEFDVHSFITNHPYVPLQKARLLKEAISKFKSSDEQDLIQVEHSYEEAIESIECDYRYLMGSNAHASLLMYFGIFLCRQRYQYSRAIRFLEEAKSYFNHDPQSKAWFITCNNLSIAYGRKYKESNDTAYESQLRKLVNEVCIKVKNVNITRYKSTYSSWIK